MSSTHTTQPWKHNLHLRTNFHLNHDFRLRYSDKTIFKMAAICHLEFLKFGVLVIWPVLERDFALPYKISR